MFLNISLFVILVICVITDLHNRKIYNAVIFPGILLALVTHLITGGIQPFLYSVLSCFVGLFILLLPYFMGGMGAGDVKLLALIGAFKGISFVVYTAIYMGIIGGLLSLFVLLFKKGGKQKIKLIFYFLYGLKSGIRIPLNIQKQSFSGTVPYGVAIAGGVVWNWINGGI
ncbi:A24 family peptidase [Chengkuizengella axinellae]|uniref:Prepilin peptidase n=1 Tax=Chengkuizengella axinellae TaxID=3064388 RepID=A0ABT9IYV0_9BACL|nr:prepilin peptidase [Chengkuizengella sp. 2205SS18-9]MDP5274490.1 prepilin peptidase [Chengkuizengella sp. 2205SS18-9]